MLNSFLLIDLILVPLLHLFSEKRFKVFLVVLELGRWMDFSRQSTPRGVARDSRQETWQSQRQEGQAQIL